MLRPARTIGIALILVPAITVFMQSAAVRLACADELDDDSAAARGSVYQRARTAPAAVRLACADELDDDSAAALRSLYEGSPAARVLGEKAAGILVFPNIVKA